MGSENSKHSAMDDFEVPIFKHGKNISVLNYLSRGGEGTVYTAQTKNKGTVCVKVFHKFGISEQKEVDKLVKMRGKHPNILEIFGTYEGFNPHFPQTVYRGYVMEFMSGGSLEEAIYSDKHYEPNQAYRWMCQISHAVIYMHLKKIAHLDLKPLNMLLDVTGTRVKIGDFGLSKNLMFSKVTARRATYAYMAPELFDEEIHLQELNLYKADVYSLGVTFWEILYRKPPFDGLSEAQIYKKVVAGERPSMEKFIWEEEIGELIEKSWIGIPYERCTLPDYIYTLNTVLQEPTDFRDLIPVALQAVVDNDHATPLHIAARQGDNLIVEMLIITGASVSSNGKDGWTPLHYAVWHNYIEIVRTLLKHHASIGAASVFGFTPLHLAAQNGHVEMVKLLLQHGAIIDSEDNYHHTPLDIAAFHGHHLVVEMLITAGASVSSKNEDGETPLHFAVRHNRIESARTLLKHRAPIDTVNGSDYTPLHCAAQDGHVEMVKLLLEHGAIIDIEDIDHHTPLHVAAFYGHHLVVEMFITAGASASSKNEDGWTPLHCAAIRNHIESAGILLKHCAPIDAATVFGENSLHFAAQKGHVDMVKFLLQHGAIIDSEDNDHHTPLHVAAFYGHHLVVEMLIAARSSVSAKNEDGETPLRENSLHFTVQKGHLDMVKFLHQHGATIDSRNNDLCIPFHLTVQEGHDQVMDVLLGTGASIYSEPKNGSSFQSACFRGAINYVTYHLKHGANPNTAYGGQTALCNAAYGNHADVVNILIQYGANVDARDNNGRSALHYASYEGNVDVVTLLLQAGANPNSIDKNNKTPLEYARAEGQNEVAAILVKYGAR